MFQVADNISQTAFYIATDDWTQKPDEEWKVTKRYGAFHNAVAFTTSMLKKSTNRCFYEIIRQNRPCKAYIDLEDEPGALTAEEGEAICQAVIRE